MQVQNNTAAFNVWTSYTGNIGNMQSSMGRLSSGIKKSTDDPAGIGISEYMRMQYRDTASARANVDNGISLFQTADSWLQKVNDQIGRMSELAIQAGGIASANDKETLQEEFKQMQAEIVRIGSFYTSAAKFNGLYLFRGGDGISQFSGSDSSDAVGTGKFEIQIGADIDQKVEVDLVDIQVSNTEIIGSVHTATYSSGNNYVAVDSSHHGVQWRSVIDTNHMSVTSSEVIGRLDVAVRHIAGKRAEIAAQQNRFTQTRDGLLGYEDNVRAAESKIRDVDMARESTNFAKYQILTNASNAMLAQANQLPGSVLQLLG